MPRPTISVATNNLNIFHARIARLKKAFPQSTHTFCTITAVQTEEGPVAAKVEVEGCIDCTLGLLVEALVQKQGEDKTRLMLAGMLAGDKSYKIHLN